MEFNFTINELSHAARWFWENAGTAKVFAFHGEMGAGKTTLIQAICRERGVKEGMGSPTFSIINEYRAEATGATIYHMDLYRLKSAAEAVQAGVEECFYSGDPCLLNGRKGHPVFFPRKQRRSGSKSWIRSREGSN